MSSSNDNCAAEKQAIAELQLILDSVPALIAYKDAHNRFLRVNRALAESVGLSAQQIEGKTCEELFPAEAAAHYYADDLEVMRAGKPKLRIIERMQTASGETKWMRTDKIPYRDANGDIAGVVVVALDITQMKQAAENDRLAREALDLLNRAEAFPNTIRDVLRLIKQRLDFEAVAIRLREGDDFPYYDSEGFSEDFLRTERYLCARDGAGQIIRDETGEPVPECMCGNVIRGQTDATQPFFTQGGSFWTNSTTELLAATTEKDRPRTRNRCHDDGYESVALIPLRSGGETLGLLQLNDRRPNRFTPETIQFLEGLGLSLGLAISHRRVEEALQESNRELQDALKQLQDVHKQMIEQERLSALGQMASGVAHDFNNALMPILGYTDLLLSTPGILDKRQETVEMLELVRASAVNAAETVRRLREFYRSPDQSKHRPVDLAGVIQDTVALTRLKWKEESEAKGIPIDVQMEIAPVPPVTGDAHELSRLLTNLIFNAVDAMPKGGSITIRLRPQASDKHAVLEVQDTGVGMSEEVRRRCLEPFFTTKSGRGVGLGLSIAHGIAQRHRGGISIQSEPGQGARAIVRLPLEGAPERSGGSVGSDGSYGRVAPAQPGEEPAPDRRPPVPSWRVLLVDDEESGRLVVRRYLEADGHTAMLAADGREGLQTFEAGRFDLVILDRAMPGMSGDELATAIKARSPATPVIMLTGFSPTMAGQADPPAAVDKIITKPLTRAALRRAVAEIMAERMPRPESGTA